MNSPPEDGSWSVMSHRLSVWDRRLPPDLSLHATPECGANAQGVFQCTRLPGHTGRHAAGDGDNIVAVWADGQDVITRRHGGWYRR